MSSEQPDSVVESLRQERLIVQKKTFTKWANIHLQKHGLVINDLFQDLGDGCRLMKLLESLTGEKLGKPAKGNSRIKKIENVSRCLMFLHSKKMRLENISSEDIVDGKPHLILGLIWTIILRCEINNRIEGVTPDVPQVASPSTDQIPDHKIAKDSLMLWCQTKTNGYPRVHVRDFHRSWRDGLAFNALIHSHLPTVVDFSALKQEEHLYNLDNAFTLATKHIGVPRLLDPEDVDTDNPDEKSILVYVSTFCKGLGKHKVGMTGGKRISNVIYKTMDIDKLKNDYCETSANLLQWINSKLQHFISQDPLESLESIQQEIYQFKTYRTVEKPKQFEKKNEVEALLFSIQMQRLGGNGWIPPENVSPAAIEKAWSKLQRAEHEHEISIRNQLKAQERLENLAYKFETKRSVREGYIEEIQKILTDPNYGASIKQTDATFKKHEAIRTGIIAREIMMKDLFRIAEILIESNYRRKENIILWKNETENKWKYVLHLLEAYDEKFSHLKKVINILEEMDSVLEEMQQLQGEMNAERKPLDITASLQKHALKEVQVASWGEAVNRFEEKVVQNNEIKDNNLLQTQMQKLKDAHENLTKTCQNRRKMLEHELKIKQQNEYVEEIMAWIFEKKVYCTSAVYCKDLASAFLLQKKHKSLGLELKLQKELIENIEEDRPKQAIAELEDLLKEKEEYIALAVETYQYICDVNECTSWITENIHLLSTLDFGIDELTSEALLRRHTHMETKISAYSSEIKSLREVSERLKYLLSKLLEEKVTKMKDNRELKKTQSMAREMCQASNLSAEHVSSIQEEMENAYSELQNQSQKRKARLHHHCMYFNFKDRCDEVEKWMRDKEKIMDLNDFGNESEEIEKRFEEYMIDMMAHGLIINELVLITRQLEEEKAEQANTAKILLDDVQRRWEHLRELTMVKEKSLKGFTSVLFAHRLCEENISWLDETLNSEVVDSIADITSFDDLRRKQEAIDRDLFLIEERVKQALVLAEKVSNEHPDQRDLIQKRIKVLEDNWKLYQIKTKDRKKNIEKNAGISIFKSNVNSLLEWCNAVQCKIRMREKISDKGVAASVAKDHKDLGEEIAIQEDRFNETEELGLKVLQVHPEMKPLLEQITEGKKIVNELWQSKQDWLSQSLALQIFNREANHLQSLCASQNALLEVVELGKNLSDVEILIRHHESFMDTLKVQRNRFIAFEDMVKTLTSADHEQKEYIHTRHQDINEMRKQVLQKADERMSRLQQEFQLQEFKLEGQEMLAWIGEKNKRALDLLKTDNNRKLSSKLKRLETLEAELTANSNRLQNVYMKGEKLLQECSFALEDLQKILEDIENAWNLLCERLDINRQNLFREKELKDFYTTVELILTKIDHIKRSTESSLVANDPRTVKNLLKKQETLEAEQVASKEKVSKLIDQGQMLIEELGCDENDILKVIEEVKQKLEKTITPLTARRENLETCWRFHQFKSEVERELMWISDQILLLSAENPCQNLLDAQKLQKTLENLEVTLNCHQKIVENLKEQVLVLVVEKECIVDITKTCELMEEDWNKLLGIFHDKKAKANFNLKAQMFYSEASEIDGWISEKKQILNSADYGKDEDSVIKLLTKQKDAELEIDSYKGLVEELANQAEALIELNNSESKIVKNRMEIIDNDMKNIQSLCSVRRKKLLESKSQKEFEKETEELEIWISEQMSQATSEDYGEDYEHVLLLHSNFEFFRARVEAGSKRIIQYEDFTNRLINSKCSFADNVTKSLEKLSSRWSELLECLEARAFKLEAAAEIHRYHRDVTDILSRIHNYYEVLPNDLGSSLAHAQQLARKHDATENELVGIEAQVHLLLEDSQRLQDTYPGGNEEHIQMQLSLVIENWNSLQLKVSNRKAKIIASQKIHRFISQVREEENWSKTICFELGSDNIPRHVEQISSQHHITNVEIETRLTKYELLRNEGETILVYKLFHNQINEKLKALTEIEKKIKVAWEARCELIKKTKAILMFLNEAKQIQTSIATKEVQLCGREAKETVEDLEVALKKHSEFQKTMSMQEEKFVAWEQQGKSILKQNIPEAERVQKKLEDLSSRRKRLLNFSSERCESLSNLLRLARFKSDIIEVETWIKEKKNKLRLLLKDYNNLNVDEKIKCLQKQQVIQAEIEAHECIIQRIIQQKKEIPQIGEELTVRVELILENWGEVKGNADRMGRELKDAHDMLAIHDYFEKAESWIKQKEFLIQKNDSGKDYEHCMALQAQLDDKNSSTQVDEVFIQNMKRLAEKLSTKENQNGVYSRYERIHERLNYLKEDIALYRKKLNAAAEVHSFIKDMDDTIDRIREKFAFLSTREDIQELEVVEMMQRKLDDVEQDLTAIDKKVKEQCALGSTLAERYNLSAGKINDKTNQVKRVWQELRKEQEEKRKHLHAEYISLKFIKDAEDMEKIVNDIIEEMEYGGKPSDSADAVSYLQAHNDYKAQIIACEEKIKSLEKRGETVLQTPGVPTEDVENTMKSLLQMRKSLHMSWDYRLNSLVKYKDVQIFTEKAKQMETWFASKEAFLSNKDVGVSMSSVEALIRKHENFEKSCNAYFDKLEEIKTMVPDLHDEEDEEEIRSWFEHIFQRKHRLIESMAQRKKVLMDSKAFQQILMEIYEISNWMNEKIRILSDESRIDLTNLLNKTQKHATLEAEIASNHSRIVLITSKTDELLKEDHFASEEIWKNIQNLESLWEQLVNTTNEQKVKLNEAKQVLEFKQKLEDINNELEQTDAQLNMNTYMHDIASIQQEIEKLQIIEKDMEETGEKLKILNDNSEMLDHTINEEILLSLKFATKKFQDIDEAISVKFTKLQDDLSLAGLEKDANDELSWIEDNIAVCQNEDYFDGVVSVQVLQKKLQALETEMVSRKPLINSIIERGIRMNNPSAEAKVKSLEKRFHELEDSISLRRLRLSDALEAQMYYFEVAQAEIWIKEKMTQVSSCDSGYDIYTVQEFKKKMSTIEATSNGFKQNIKELEEVCSNLEGRGHFDHLNIRNKQEELTNKYEELICNILKQIAILREEEEFFIYQNDVNVVLSHLKSMTKVTSSIEVGQDLEHVESQLRKTELFRNKMCSYEKSMEGLQRRAKCLVDGGHSESTKIKQLLTELEDAWLECDYSAESRCKALEQAKFIQSFNKSVDETISWICEKDAILSSDNFGHDLQSTQSLLKHHETLEGDLKAIETQVEALEHELANLSEKFPHSKDSLCDKYNILKEAWEKCYINGINRKEKLLQVEKMQSYFDEAREFQAWINEMSALITRPDLPEDVAGCEAFLAQHDEYKSDIDFQIHSFRNFEAQWKGTVGNDNFMFQDVEEKLKNLNSSFDDLLLLWKEWKQTHEQNLDLQLFKKKLLELEIWLQNQKHCLGEEDGRSLAEVEYLIRKHEQIEQKISLYESKFQELKKATKAEEEIIKKKHKEELQRNEEEKLLEQKQILEIKKKEEERLLKERRKERVGTNEIQQVESEDIFLPHVDLPEREQVFKRFGSRRSFPDQSFELSKPKTPVISAKKFSVSKEILPPTNVEGFLERKLENEVGGKRATSRAWKKYYTVLCGQLLCFFKDKASFIEQSAAKAPINILGAKCSFPKDYHKKKYVFRLEPSDKSSYLFDASNEIKRNEWMKKINYTACLHPSMQLMNVDERPYDISDSYKRGSMQRSKEHYDTTHKNMRKSISVKEEDALNVNKDNIYDNLEYAIDTVSNTIRDVPYDVAGRSDTVTSYDDDLQSARSSFSNQSSYRTAVASTSSISTLQDEHAFLSSDEDVIHSMPEPLTRTISEISVDPSLDENMPKHQTIPRNMPPRRENKRKWKPFSLRRKR